MASVPSQSSWFCALKPINIGVPSSTKQSTRNCCSFKNLIKASMSSNPEPEKTSDDFQTRSMDPVKLAFEKAKAYKKSNPIPTILQNPVSEYDDLENKSGGSASEVARKEEVPLAVKLAMEKAKEYSKNKEIVVDRSETGKSEAFSGLQKKESVSELTGGKLELSASVKLAMEKAKEYQKNKGVMGSDKGVKGREISTGLEGGDNKNSGSSLFKKNAGKKEELTISGIDFVGLGFADKKNIRGLPPGLLPVAEPFPEGDMPEVEILVGDTSNFGNSAESEPKLIEDDESDMYKPKVSTWGVFPRPSNISKKFGGGRVIRPGEQLETTEDKAAKQKRTRELLAAYRRKTGLSIDPKLKVECEKALKDGDSLMDCGNLKEALLFYENVMEKLTFQSELHGLAALQWSICQDSLSRPNEARAMYEKLQSHPNVKVSKRAKQFLFGFQALEMMKVKSEGVSPKSTGYQIFFEKFIEEKSNYSFKDAEVEEGVLSQALPYILFLFTPIFVVLLIAVRKGI